MAETTEDVEKRETVAHPQWQLVDEIHAPISAQKRNEVGPVWDMSQERAFLENLMNQRFTFFLVFFSAIVAGVVNAKSELVTKLLLGFGSVMTVLFAKVLWRSHRKLDLILDDLKTDKTHPATIIDRRAGRGSVRWILGWGIPWLCCGILIAGFVLAIAGRLPSFSDLRQPPTGSPQMQRVQPNPLPKPQPSK